MSGYNEPPSYAGAPAAGSSAVAAATEAIDLEPASGASFFRSDYKKHDDLKQMLETNKDSLKLEAMKRIISMVAKGKDASDLFPAVVKNVVSKNIEIKKLVYVYLTRYAEEQQDLALLSISTFQRALKDPNQLIRASALRVLSSIRVPVIVPIMMLSIRDSAVDLSPFVRKTAAHAIPKLYSLDPEQKDELVGVIEKLLGDRTTLVVGSAVMAFEEVCPERIDLIHKNFRKLCNLLVDVEEWGQVEIINMLTRYARTQFVDPNREDEEDGEEEAEADGDFYENSDDEAILSKKIKPKMDQDHRLLLRCAKPLLQSRNASVIMAVAQLFHHCAPKAEVQVVAKAMIRLLRSHREVQAVVLNCIASMTSARSRNKMFDQFLRNFFIRSSDPTHIKILKLEIMTNMATEANIGMILREFQSYITSQDKVCVAATIQAIGRCATSIEEVTDTCLNGLVHLLSSKDQAVVAESVIVIKKLLQTQAGEHKEIITHMAKLVDSIFVPAARAAILWVVGEYSERIPKIAPDVLRKMTKSFISEEVVVKLQVLNLAAKLCLTNPKQTKVLAQHVFNLAKYDQNYDIRDRARFIRAFLFPPSGQEDNPLVSKAKKIFLATKPAPVIKPKFQDRDIYQLGSLSHFLNTRALGYQDLPGYPEEAPDASVRNVEQPKPINPWEKSLFYDEKKESNAKSSPNNGAHGKDDGKASGTSDSDSSSESSGSSSDSSSDSSDSDSEAEAKVTTAKHTNGSLRQIKPVAAVTKKKKESSSSETSSSSSEDDAPKKPPARKNEPPKSNLDLLLDFGDDLSSSGAAPALTPFLSTATLSPSSAGSAVSASISEAVPAFVSTKPLELLNKMQTEGNLEVLYRYTRSPHLYSPQMCNIELTLVNVGDSDLADIKVGAKNLAPGMTLHEFPGLAPLSVGSSRTVNIGINFNDTTQAAKFDLVHSGRSHQIVINPAVGELVRAVQMPESAFLAEQAKLRGMNEAAATAVVPSANASEDSVRKRIYVAANVLQVPSSSEDTLLFAGQTLTSKALVLVTVRLANETASITVNTEKIVIGGMLVQEIKKHLETV